MTVITIEDMEIIFEDLNDLEEIVTPGVGTGCNCTINV